LKDQKEEATMSDKQPQKILILTNDTGFGHRSAANAIVSALQEQHGEACTVEIVNPTEHKDASPILRNSQANSDQMVRERPELYRVSYEATRGL
jgi:hypothetical protein